MEGGIKNEVELIRRYRETSLIPECDSAIEDVINECITSDSSDRIVTLDLRDTKLSDSLKKKIQDEFSTILTLMKFNQNSHEIFRKWYVDGRIYFHKVVDKNNIKKGIVDIRPIDPLKIKKVRNVTKDRDPKTGIEQVKKVDEFFVFNDKGYDKTGTASAEGNTVKIAPGPITFTTSGLLDYTKNVVVGYLHKALKTANQLSMMEDALVIYRISRPPERRIFYIDVGNLPKSKAEQYLSDVMNRYRNKLVYNAQTGEIKDDRKHMSMLEDFYLEGKVEEERRYQLCHGQNLSEIEDIEYFKKKLYRALNVPISRMESDNGFNMGRSSEISRDELKFNKFTNRLQKKFARVFTDILKTQLVLRGVVTGEEFDKFKDFILYDFATDNHFTELKEIELMRERFDTLSQASEYVGKYFSHEYVRKYILRQTEDEIEILDAQILQDKEKGGDDEDEFGGF